MAKNQWSHLVDLASTGTGRQQEPLVVGSKLPDEKLSDESQMEAVDHVL